MSYWGKGDGEISGVHCISNSFYQLTSHTEIKRWCSFNDLYSFALQLRFGQPSLVYNVSYWVVMLYNIWRIYMQHRHTHIYIYIYIYDIYWFICLQNRQMTKILIYFPQSKCVQMAMKQNIIALINGKAVSSHVNYAVNCGRSTEYILEMYFKNAVFPNEICYKSKGSAQPFYGIVYGVNLIKCAQGFCDLFSCYIISCRCVSVKGHGQTNWYIDGLVQHLHF